MWQHPDGPLITMAAAQYEICSVCQPFCRPNCSLSDAVGFAAGLGLEGQLAVIQRQPLRERGPSPVQEVLECFAASC